MIARLHQIEDFLLAVGRERLERIGERVVVGPDVRVQLAKLRRLVALRVEADPALEQEARIAADAEGVDLGALDDRGLDAELQEELLNLAQELEAGRIERHTDALALADAHEPSRRE